MFSVRHKGFWFHNKELKKNKNLVKRGVATKRFFFLSICVLQNVKSYRFFFGPFFWQFWVDVQKNTVKIGISAHFKKQKIGKIYICCKVKTGPRFGGFKVKNWSKFKVKNWSKFFFFSLFSPIFIVFWGYF